MGISHYCLNIHLRSVDFYCVCAQDGRLFAHTVYYDLELSVVGFSANPGENVVNWVENQLRRFFL